MANGAWFGQGKSTVTECYAPTVEEAASSPDVPDHDNDAIASKSNPLEIDEIFASMFQGDI